LTVTAGPTDVKAGDDITLDKANDFVGTVNVLGGNDVTLNDVNSITLGGVTTTGKLDVTAATDITLNGALNVASLELQATAGDITQTAGTLTVSAGPTDLKAGDDITMDKANDFVGKVNVKGGNHVTLNDVNSITLGGVTTTGKLDVTAATDITLDGVVNVASLELQATLGDINQGASSTLTVSAGPTDLKAGDDITLDKANDFVGTVNVLGSNDVTLNDVNSITLGGVTTTGKLDVTAATDITLDGVVNVASLDLQATLGDINQGASSTLTVSAGPTDLKAGDDITLDKANDFVGTVNVLGGKDVVLNDANAMMLGAVTTTGNLTLNSAGDLNLGTSTVGGDLTAISGNGNITQSGALTVVDGSVFNAGTGDILLNNAGNILANGVTVIAANSTIVGENAGGSAAAAAAAAQAAADKIAADKAAADKAAADKAAADKAAADKAAADKAAADKAAADKAAADKAAADKAAADKAEQAVVSQNASKTGQGQVAATLDTPAMPEPLALNALVPSNVAVSSASSTTNSSSTGGAKSLAASGSHSAGVTVDLLSASSASTIMMAAVSLPKGSSTVGVGFSFALPEAIQALAQQGSQTVDPQASLSDGSPLPAWLRFDASTLRFDAQAVPTGAFPMQVLVTVAGTRVMVVISERIE
jgi:hypothetical protein